MDARRHTNVYVHTCAQMHVHAHAGSFFCSVISPPQDSRIAWWNVRPGDRSRACKVSDAPELDPAPFLWP